MRKVLLISKKTMHYRIPVLNYIYEEFKNNGFDFAVRTGKVIDEQGINIDYDCKEIELDMGSCTAEINDIKPDAVILALHLKDLVQFPLINWLKKNAIPVVIWKHGINLQDRKNIIKNIIFKRIHNKVDGIILFSPNEKKYIALKNQKKVFIAPNTLNFNSIPEIQYGKEELLAKYGVPYAKNVLFVGRIQPRKKLDDLLLVFKEINNDIGLIIVGPGINKEQSAMIEAMDNVKYLGEIYDPEKINEIFKMSSLFCIPGTNGLGLNHAFYWGLPAVTEDVWHSPEIYYLKDGVNGYVVPKDNIDMLKEKIEYILSEDDIYGKFSAAAKETMLGEGDIKNMAEGFIGCINRVVA